MVASGLVGFTRLLVGARAQWRAEATPGQCLYFANHCSHLDTLAIWSALTPEQRASTRPVAARDYWDQPGLRRYLANRVLRVILIERRRDLQAPDPLTGVFAALEHGDSLILFPEGTRTPDRLPQPFRGGLFRIAETFPAVHLVPVYLDTLHRSLPKGSHVPLPLYCNVRFGAPLKRDAAETRADFLRRAHAAVCALAEPIQAVSP
ncbi:MAG: 1-acyl-sn-glycerol-3-phosphate acyltransferase [Rhodanobacteraceae bacterium]|nr:1-acyl-sn-glycerol-3-phosphate acyltransferase [Rhodanobacteraceae bacterium]